MTKAEFLAKMEADESWAPGWEAIDGVFRALYPGQKPFHYATVSRAVFGGKDFLDGCSIYPSPKGYFHLVTYGMSELYAEPEALGGEWSKWGYEMTMKLRGEKPEDCLWALDLLNNLARYTFTQKRFFEPWQFVDGRGAPIRTGTDTALTSLIIVPDTEVQGLDTLYGRLEFLQLVGITQAELSRLSTREEVRALAEQLRQAEPWLVTDLDRR